MKITRCLLIASLVGLSAGIALAQGGPGPGGPDGPGSPGGAGPAVGMPGKGPGAGPGAARWGTEYTPGWALMTAQERNVHRERMRAMTNYEECKAFQQQHHEQMAARAKERGVKTPSAPRRDACAGLKR